MIQEQGGIGLKLKSTIAVLIDSRPLLPLLAVLSRDRKKNYNALWGGTLLIRCAKDE
tara:strand:+ start:454 stop:624 length:171 start_codon:yes stop_codon:yes gene_type:complete